MSSEYKKTADKSNSMETNIDTCQVNDDQSLVEASSEIKKELDQSEHIEALERQLKESVERERDVKMRARAEVDNVRRRAIQDIEKAHKFALERFSSDLLPVIDNMERALEMADKDNSELVSMIQGIELTLKSLLDVVQKFGIKAIDEINIPFNPDIHQAMTVMESADSAPNYVLMIIQKGYTLNGRLIRPAMVAVSKEKE